MISKADKVTTIVVLYQDDYIDKTDKFISKNNYTIANNDITKILRRYNRNTVNECQHVIQKSEIWKYVNVNPMAPTIIALIKINQEGAPITPIINWKNAQTYVSENVIMKTSHTYFHLPYTFNVGNNV
jgi:hypothetical protein